MDPTSLGLVWAQTSGSNATSLASLALRRWFVSLTLSSPEPVPSLFALWAWLGGLFGLFVLSLIAQGPIRAVGQIFDIAGHVRLFGAAMGRLRRSGRVVAVVIGMTVVAWTASQTAAYQREQGKADLLLLTKSRSLAELSFEQGVMSALTPLRDLAGLASNLPLLLAAGLLAFRLCADRWANPSPFTSPERDELFSWANPVWICALLFLVYRLASLAALSSEREELRDLPWQGCLMVEPVVIPLIMAVGDGFLLAWVVSELRNATLSDVGNDALDVRQAAALMPGALLACLLALPARYVATGVWLASSRVPASVAATTFGRYLRWQLNWGLADLQGAALLGTGLAGAVAWSRGSVRSAVRSYSRLLVAEAGHLVVVLAAAGAAAGAAAAAAYLIVLSLPPQPWVLSAADSYAHYATLPIGLVTLSALIELGERSLPLARLAEEPPASAG